ncbi:MAG: hypothetical protein GX225_04510 [Clostridiales bacterium]|nr:hypothetical protein [Clostridiales bacterium]
MKKKIILVTLCTVMVMSLVACNNRENEKDVTTQNIEEKDTTLSVEPETTTKPQEVTTEEVTTVVSPVERVEDFDINAAMVDLSGDELIEGDDFSDAVFVGDSRTEALSVYHVLDTSTILATRGLTSIKIMEDKFIDLGNGTKGTVIDYLKLHKFNRIYIMFGINEVGCDIDSFKHSYKAFIEAIKEVQPDIDIYIQSIIPMEEGRTDEIYNNEVIAKFNVALGEISTEEKVPMLNVSAAVVGEDGTLQPELSRDGVHLTTKGLKKYLNYLILATDELSR